jgi:hypothetical protein
MHPRPRCTYMYIIARMFAWGCRKPKIGGGAAFKLLARACMNICMKHGDARLTWPFGTSLCPLKLQKLREDVMNAHLMRLSLRRLF